LLPPVAGGATRQESVRNGLEALAEAAVPPSLVLIHDAARPFASAALIDRAVAAGRAHGAAAPGTAVTDTIKIVSMDGAVSATPPRDSLRAIQTPQAFAFDRILSAHRRAAAAGLHTLTDDAAVAEWAGLDVTVFEGDPANVKLTHAADFADAERRLGGAACLWITRVGTGFDVHAFAPGDHLWLGGVRVPHERGVTAHSDGDVVLHALTDAMLGALCDGDIGVHFPPSDPRWRGAGSDRFLAFAAERVRERRGLVDHLDVTVLCEAPRIGPLREPMRQRIAAIAGIAVSSVSVKATTTERLGFLGRSEGIAAQASATIRLPIGAE
jgi:2-C-methyl-D-erythritol 4-phosphate cytidylyltransferase/2-C-methyl-D-erythritol 2,4-cyclodiphosphate synthase